MNGRFDVLYYYANWSIYARNYQVSDIPIDYTPSIAYAFYDIRQDSSGFWIPVSGDPWADTESAFFGNFGQFKKLKDQGKNFNLQLSIGGWSWSKNFSLAFQGAAQREAFANEVIAIFKKYQIFNGVNIDWEYISPVGQNYGLEGNIVGANDPENFAAFLALMRRKFNENGMSSYTISAAITGDPKKIDILPLASMIEYLDQFHVMTYDYNSSSFGPTLSGHHTNLKKASYTPFSVEESVEAYLIKGVPAYKIYIGVAFYSRGFANTDGLGKPSYGVVDDKSWEPGVCDYKDLPRPGATELWDDTCKASYSYDPVRKILNSYDTVRSVTEKCNYIKQKGLAGAIIWEISGDVNINSDRSLVKCLYDNLITPSKSYNIQPLQQTQPLQQPQALKTVISTPVVQTTNQEPQKQRPVTTSAIIIIFIIIFIIILSSIGVSLLSLEGSQTPSV